MKSLCFRKVFKLKIFLSVFGFLIFIFSCMIGMDLLEKEQLSGGEFVTLIIAFSVIGLIISMATEIQEISVAGNIVKLKEVKKEAENSIAELKKARTENFKFLLRLAARFPNPWGDNEPIDARSPDFWMLYEQIKVFGCERELDDDLKAVIKVLLGGQLSCLYQYSDDVKIKFPIGSIPEPNKLMILAFNNSVDKEDKFKESLLIALDEYKKLYQLYK